ncbi:hypothetical protein [Nocardioides sp. SYSU D00038]|uniref:hypothetical protein n=1 Tax=Nocardioides sp. SYSU D00038 TaxID=2812554 RepID=UPI001967E4B3|nr:hypothetical protein [Nocardioides sp. SYSU D00038]
MSGLGTHRTRLRTAVAGLAVVGLPLAGLSALAPAAQAAPVASAGFGVGAHVYWDSMECTGTDNGDDDSGEQPANGATVTRSRSVTSVVTSTGDAADVTNAAASVTGRMRMVVTEGNLSELDLWATGRATATPQKDPSECNVNAQANVEGGAQFTLTRPTWLTATVTGNKQTTAVVQGGGEDRYILGGVGSGGQHTSSQLLPPGQYEVQGHIGWSSNGSGFLDRAGARAKAAAKAMGEGTGRVHVELRPAGSATGRAFGSGKKFLKPGDAVSCATGKVAATFTRKAKQVEKATFLVNGKKRKTVKNPKKGRTVLLPLPATRTNTVKVKLVVDPPGRRGSVTKTVTRSYRACGSV